MAPPRRQGTPQAELAESQRNVRLLNRLLQRANEDLLRQSSYDTLTGLANRALFYEQLNRFVALARREHRSLPVLAVGLVGYSRVSGTLGRDVGNAVLREFAARLSGAIRESDMAARLGDGVFAVVLPTTHSVEGALRVAEKIAAVTEAPFRAKGQNVTLQAGIGVALFPENGENEQTVVRLAEGAMNEVYRAGGGYVVCTPDRPADKSTRILALSELRDAVERDEFSLHYQPKVAMQDGRLMGAEALVRWRHPRYGLVAPGDFIPVVEGSSLISPVTLWVLDAALEWVRTWHEAGQDLNISVNLSPRLLHNEELPGHVAELLERHKVEAKALTLEITESALMIDADRAMDVVSRLNDHGVAISIDDFGTGYSSLAYLRRLPVKEIKIDRSFVSSMAKDPDDLTIVRSVIDLAKNLGKSVVAEGVENTDVWQLLSDLGCDAAQGYHISRPLDDSEFQSWVKDYRQLTDLKAAG